MLYIVDKMSEADTTVPTIEVAAQKLVDVVAEARLAKSSDDLVEGYREILPQAPWLSPLEGAAGGMLALKAGEFATNMIAHFPPGVFESVPTLVNHLFTLPGIVTVGATMAAAAGVALVGHAVYESTSLVRAYQRHVKGSSS